MSPLPATIESYIDNIDIHELNREKSGGEVIFSLVAIALFLFESYNVYLLVTDVISPFLAFIFHIIAIFAGFLYVTMAFNRNLDVRMALLLAITVALTGPFGAAGSLLTLILNIIYNRYSQSFKEWFETIFPHKEISLPEEINENIISGRDESSKKYSVIPFMDVMSVGSEAQKREALSKMTSMFHPSFASAINRALNDPNNAIRVQAATAITRIENSFLEKSITINKIAGLRPYDANIKLIQAKHYDDYAYTGILDSEREEANRAKALEYYQEYLKMKPDDSNVRLFIGRLLKRSGDFSSACEWFKKCLDEGFVTDVIVTWYIECLYELGRYSELRNVCSVYYSRLSEDERLSPSFIESIRIWTGDEIAINRNINQEGSE